MYKNRLGFYLMTGLISAFIFITSCSAATSKLAARVNRVAIRNTVLDAAMNNFIENQKAMGVVVKEEDKDKLRKDILEELISAELLYQESKKAGLGNLSEEVTEQFENIKKGFESEDEFKNILKDRGVTERELKADIKKGVYITNFLENNVYKDISITEEDKRREYEKNKDKLNIPEQVKASHILIRVEQGASEEKKKNAMEKIQSLREKLINGEDFAELAKENSEDPSSANGGDLGYFARNNMVKPFEEAAFGLEPDGISEIVETPFGYHIIKLMDKTPARILSYEEVNDDMGKFLLNQRRAEGLNSFVEELRNDAKIEVY